MYTRMYSVHTSNLGHSLSPTRAGATLKVETSPVRRSGKSWSLSLLASVTLHFLPQGAKGNLTARAPRKYGSGSLGAKWMVLLNAGDEIRGTAVSCTVQFVAAIG
ncbi:unnamed protein product [Clonostachys rosea]|uniref:Uncharacterized protein n=1 Tax=Bionectria ochroleuca TaxID=29856 RepID=A0ABY6TSA7_BIOOC|nr:unnamed protein product [Clonostachys rosea]